MKRNPITQEDIGILFLAAAILLGGWVRLFAPLTAGFPLNDGGMFLIMMDALKNNNFILPASFQFNGLTLPFAYPPLGFYIGSWLSHAFGIDLVSILQWQPAIVTIIAIPAFYWLARSIFESNFTAGLATFIYAFTPRASSWANMGGGLTRSLGLVFLLLAIAIILRLYKTQEKKYLPFAILFSSLTVLSHPEAAVHTAGISLIFFLFHGRSKLGWKHTLLIAAGTLLLTSMWWLPILLRFGLTPYLTASQTGFHSAVALFLPFFLPLTDEPQMTLIAVLGLIGWVFSIVKKQYLLPILYILPYLTEPRSAPVYATIALAMLTGFILVELILPALSNQPFLKNRPAQIVLIYLVLYLFGSAAFLNVQFAGNAVSEANRTAFDWVHTNLPADSRILVLTGETDTFCDGISEWFPALTGRISPTTVQGREWLPGFNTALEQQRDLQACLNSESPLECIEENTRLHQTEFEYIYIARQSTFKQSCRVTSPLLRGDALITELSTHAEYQPVYQTHEVLIFTREPKTP